MFITADTSNIHEVAIYPSTNLLSNTKQGVKGGSGNVFGYYVINTNTSPIYLKFYNGLVENITIGTSAPKYVRQIPPSSALLVNGTELLMCFTSGITVAITSNNTTADNSAPSTGSYVEIYYK